MEHILNRDPSTGVEELAALIAEARYSEFATKPSTPSGKLEGAAVALDRRDISSARFGIMDAYRMAESRAAITTISDDVMTAILGAYSRLVVVERERIEAKAAQGQRKQKEYLESLGIRNGETIRWVDDAYWDVCEGKVSRVDDGERIIVEAGEKTVAHNVGCALRNKSGVLVVLGSGLMGEEKELGL